LRQSQQAGEFDSVRSGAAAAPLRFDVEKVTSSLRRDFEKESTAWQKTGDLAAAEELLTSALALNEENDPTVLTAAIAVSASKTSAPAMATFAERIVHGPTADAPGQTISDVKRLRQEIAARKYLLSLNPRDGLLATELALLHLNLGQQHKTKLLLERALRTLPDHRYVLRAAARFWCHEGEPDRALSILRGSERTRLDPWLKAAEMATEAIAGNSPSRWKAAKEIIRSGRFSSRSVSELASQVGTFELHGGSRKQALDMLRVGADSPTENAVAQIEFVGRETASFEPDDLLGNPQEAYEAEAHKAYWKNHWDQAMEACEAWHLIEPFSTRPAVFGTFVACVRSTSLDRGLALAKSVYGANPHDALLLNNLAVIHAYMGDTQQARESLRLSKLTTDPDLSVAQKATAGLIEFRSGNFDEGSRLYEDAITSAVNNRQYATALRAYTFLGREMARVGAEWAGVFEKEIDRTIEKLRSRGVAIPRDVLIIKDQYSLSKPHDFGPLSLRAPALSNDIE
jgi:tetratricopeptide (TPR) repeat protein